MRSSASAVASPRAPARERAPPVVAPGAFECPQIRERMRETAPVGAWKSTVTGKEDLYTPIHKALRSMIYGLSSRLQTNDFADLDSTRVLVNDLENDFAVARSAGCVLCVLAHHAVDEESIFFPPAAKFGNQLITSLIAEHHDFTRRELAIAQSAHEILATSSASARVEGGARLNRMSNELFGAYFVHLNREEAELVPLMQEHFTDEEQVAMRGTLLRNMPQDRMFAILGWMLPSLNVTELSDLLSSMKGAPPPLLKAISDLCAAKVDPARWGAVKTRIGW